MTAWSGVKLSITVLFLCLLAASISVEHSDRLKSQADISNLKMDNLLLRQRSETLDLALEFGFDPMIVQVTQQLATNAFKAKHEPITWRFVKTDKELAYLVLSIIQTESRGDSSAYNKSGASGLTQLLFSTAKQYDKNLKPSDLLTIPKNLEIAMTHFVSLLEKYRGNPYLSILAWNRGATGADRIVSAGIETDAYVNAVFMQAAVRNAK